MFEEISGGGGGPVDFGQQRGDDPVSTCTRKAIRVIPVGLLVRKEGSRAAWSTYSLLFNTSHGILIQEILILPPNPFIQGWSLSKSLQCLLLQTGLKPFLVTTSKKFWCHCYYIYRGILSGFFLRFWGPNSKPMNFLTNIGIFSLT